MIGNQENPIHQRHVLIRCPEVGSDEIQRRTGVIHKLSEFAVMNHKQLVEPDHAEYSRGEREESHQPLYHQHCIML